LKKRIKSKKKINNNAKIVSSTSDLNLGIICIKVGIGSLIVSIALSMLPLALESMSLQNKEIMRSITLFAYTISIAFLFYLFFKIKIPFNKSLQIKKQKSKNKLLCPQWWKEKIIEIIILGGVASIFVFILSQGYILPKIDAIINPLPQIEINCSKTNDYLEINLYNPSRYVAEDFNLLIYERLGNSHGTSYMGNELCNIDYYKIQNKYTKIECKYIPPKSSFNMHIDFENESLDRFEYDKWGKTTPKEEYLIEKCI